ncbi:SDR family NAD(P)-dependent oxidoreductase [Natronomonas sp. CBA1123]|uniref:SDR family NAD(P)-dependent oxidoreductase n=1 Tax=Natronomonas sp. CBA1123 TaxID=2668070 RepID=UPI0012E99C48|nr:SDR family NAD(P)-dependent oxidoreductase [Natronomonas sp. CBA1123]MUV85131.1 SDR family NAD(P)-dependent oxidoreductase [Natronomonas sp. CBA1123]
MISDKNILITGGAGSVGRILVRRLLKRDPNVIRIFDQSEPGLAALKTELQDDRCRFLAGDVRDKDRLKRAVDGIDLVIHTAAMKHVDVCEYNPFEAVKTNVMGLQNLIDVSIDADVDQLVFTSSDKAVHPANTMGTTKLLGEKLVTAANKYSGGHDIRLASVRFGNVVNSSQSVIPLFQEQIEKGGPITLTDPKMTRFFLTYDDVAELVIDAMEHTQGGEVFVHKMDAVRIEDLAEAMIDVFAPVNGYDSEEIEITLTGRRVGETFDEEIMTEREVPRTVENESLYAIHPEQSGENGYLTHDGIEGFEPVNDVVRSSGTAEKLSREEIINLLRTEFEEGIAR